MAAGLIDVVDTVTDNAATLRAELSERLRPVLASLDDVHDLPVSSLYACCSYTPSCEGITAHKSNMLHETTARWYLVPSDPTGTATFPPLPLAPNESSSLRSALPPTMNGFALPRDNPSPFRLLCIVTPQKSIDAASSMGLSLCGTGLQEGTLGFFVTSSVGGALVLAATPTDTVESLLARCFPPQQLRSCVCIGSVQLVATASGNAVPKAARVQDLITLRSSCSVAAVDIAGHTIMKYCVVPPWYRGSVRCDGCQARVNPTDGFLHCSTCRVDVCLACLRQVNLA